MQVGAIMTGGIGRPVHQTCLRHPIKRFIIAPHPQKKGGVAYPKKAFAA